MSLQMKSHHASAAWYTMKIVSDNFVMNFISGADCIKQDVQKEATLKEFLMTPDILLSEKHSEINSRRQSLRTIIEETTVIDSMSDANDVF